MYFYHACVCDSEYIKQNKHNLLLSHRIKVVFNIRVGIIDA